MTPAARLAAAIEVLEDIAVRRRPAADSLKEWGLAHRFAGSKDRSAIAGLVWDSLRVKSSAAFLMGETLETATARAIALGALNRARGLDVAAISNLCNGEGHAPPPLSEAEKARLTAADMSGAPAHVLGDYPEWLAPQLEEAWGERAGVRYVQAVS